MYTKEQVLKEWDKIKAYDILDTIEELESLFQEKPYGKCMRKYTAYPWCKENFFFGSPEELLEYYKNFTGIPFYMYYRIGQKFHSLTILDFYRDERNIIMAKCRCDCGNEVCRKWENIYDGKSRTCGCTKGNGIQRSSENKKLFITDLYNEFITKYWDYEKNDIDPATVEIGDSRSFWWKGYDESYEMPVSCLQAKKGGTSFPEQAILFFLKEKGIEAEHRKKIEINQKKYEVDIFLPQYNLAIEYDGFAWHKEKKKQEQQKNDAICSQGIYFIRVRETGLETTSISYGCEIERELQISEEKALSNVINAIFDIVTTVKGLTKQSFLLPEDIKNSKPLIYKQYYYAAVKDNINTTWLSKLWSKDNVVTPYMVSCTSTDKFLFKCHSAQVELSPLEIFMKLDLSKQETEEFANTLLCKGACPFVYYKTFHPSVCPANGRYHLDDYVACPHCSYSIKFPPLNSLLLEYEEKLRSPLIEIKEYQKLIKCLMEYRKIDRAALIIDGLNKSPMERDKKFLLLYETLRYPHMMSAQINKLFDNEELSLFYLDNYPYDRLKNPKPDLNLNHNENLYGITTALIHEKNISVLDKVLSLIWQKSGQAIYDKFVYNVFLQFYTNMVYNFAKFFDENISKTVFFDVLKKNVSNQYKEKIENDLRAERTDFSEQLFSEYLSDLNKLGKVTQECIRSLSSRLAHSQEHYDMFIQIIDNANIDINEIGGEKRDIRQMDDSMGALGEQLYNKRQRLIECYRYLIRNSLKTGTIKYLEELAWDRTHDMPYSVKDVILAKIHDKQTADIRTKELNYFELLFNNTEKVVHEKYGKYAKGIIPVAKPKLQPKKDVSFDFADLFSVKIEPVFPTTSAVSEEPHKQNKPNELFDIKVNTKDFDGAILERLRENDYVLHKIFLPVYSFLINIGLSKERVLAIVRNAYAIFDKGNFALDNFSDFLDKQTKLKIKENISKLNRTIPDPSLVEDIVHSYYDDSLNNNMLLLWLLGSGYQKDFIEKTKKISTYYTQLRDCIIEAMEYQALMVFLKIFYLEREAVKIEKDNTLKNIIVSAILKHVEVDRISQNTYGAFLSYSNLSKSQFTYQHYKSLMIIYIVSKQTCEDFIDKKQFESLININNSTMSEIVEFIIQEKLYNRYDTHKLLLGVLYAKAATYSDLESFINEWKSIPLYLKKCNTAKQAKIYTPEQKPQKIEITVPVVDLDTKRKQQDQQRKEEARKRQERIEAQKRSYRNQGLCQHCGGAFKKKFIFFTSDICSRCGKKKDY